MSFGSNIGYLRKKKGITQEELAERINERKAMKRILDADDQQIINFM